MLNDPADVTQEQDDYWEQKCEDMEKVILAAREAHWDLMEIKHAAAVIKTIILSDGLYSLRLLKHG